ncbi:Hypothetical predicted protein, partial [Paramuricea clavata]
VCMTVKTNSSIFREGSRIYGCCDSTSSFYRKDIAEMDIPPDETFSCSTTKYLTNFKNKSVELNLKIGLNSDDVALVTNFKFFDCCFIKVAQLFTSVKFQAVPTSRNVKETQILKPSLANSSLRSAVAVFEKKTKTDSGKKIPISHDITALTHRVHAKLTMSNEIIIGISIYRNSLNLEVTDVFYKLNYFHDSLLNINRSLEALVPWFSVSVSSKESREERSLIRDVMLTICNEFNFVINLLELTPNDEVNKIITLNVLKPLALRARVFKPNKTLLLFTIAYILYFTKILSGSPCKLSFTATSTPHRSFLLCRDGRWSIQIQIISKVQNHYVVEIDVQLKFKRAKPVKRQVFDYRNGKFDELRNFLTRNPINITPTDDIDNYWEQWKETFLTADTNSPPWIDKEVRILIRKKYRALKNYRMNRSATRKRKLRSLTQQTKRLIRRKHQEYLAKTESSFSVNPKLFWSYHKAILRHRANLHHEITFDGVTAKSAKDKATLFNAYFSFVFRSPLPQVQNQELSNITLNAEEVARSLYNLDTSKACGPDGIPTRLLQECSIQIAPSICELFNHSLHTGRIPSEWKSANVTPIHKKDHDTKVYKSIKSEDDCQILQHALTSLECWSHDNNLDFNQSKCKLLTITRKKKNPLVYVYHMNSKELLRVDKEKDLGVCVSANFNWDVHIHGYVTLVKSGLHTLPNSSLESKASKEEPPRGYYNPSMAK